ncbi:MAG: hypothetical protein L0G49_13180 [Luteococcus sp.]|uniref:hypothetical protein n=1 Tax=Luteococcus sp. TaxID=1969402 RepID=UPI0026494107|nr:hypothetical protein [Luteococcus sp.]MDN5564697.1 hypothetical protein [Luteococcus sp.]
MSYDDEKFTRISGAESPTVELSSDAVAQVSADNVRTADLLVAARAFHGDFMQHRHGKEQFTGAIDTAGRPLILTASSDGLVRVFTTGDMDCCPECCEHFADPHVPGCTLDPFNWEE